MVFGRKKRSDSDAAGPNRPASGIKAPRPDQVRSIATSVLPGVALPQWAQREASSNQSPATRHQANGSGTEQPTVDTSTNDIEIGPIWTTPPKPAKRDEPPPDQAQPLAPDSPQPKDELPSSPVPAELPGSPVPAEESQPVPTAPALAAVGAIVPQFPETPAPPDPRLRYGQPQDSVIRPDLTGPTPSASARVPGPRPAPLQAPTASKNNKTLPGSAIGTARPPGSVGLVTQIPDLSQSHETPGPPTPSAQDPTPQWFVGVPGSSSSDAAVHLRHPASVEFDPIEPAEADRPDVVESDPTESTVAELPVPEPDVDGRTDVIKFDPIEPAEADRPDVVESDPTESTVAEPPKADGPAKGLKRRHLVIAGIVAAAGFGVAALLVGSGVLSPEESPVVSSQVATPKVAAGLEKTTTRRKSPPPPVGVEGVNTRAATYAGDGVKAAVRMSPTGIGGVDELFDAYAGEGGPQAKNIRAFSPGSRSGVLECAAINATRTVCFWGNDGVRGGADITGFNRTRAATLVSQMRTDLEPR